MLDPAHITRNILADQPRVTRFPIDWNAAPGEAGAAAAAAAATAGGDAEGAAAGAEGAMEEDDDMGADVAADGVAAARGEGEVRCVLQRGQGRRKTLSCRLRPPCSKARAAADIYCIL